MDFYLGTQILAIALLLELPYLLVTKKQYPWHELWTSIFVDGLRLLSDVTIFSVFLAINIAIWRHRIFNIQFFSPVLEFIFLFVLYDIFYYILHMGSHKLRFMWASHIVHHSSEDYVIVGHVRAGFFPWQPIFFPFALLGFDPVMFFFAASLDRIYQVLIHTEAFDSFGILDYVFNSPRLHRWHHSKKGPSGGKNIAGVFIIFDRMFGTFIDHGEEEIGILGMPRKITPWDLVLYEYRKMFRDFREQKGFKNKMTVFIRTPKATAQRERRTKEIIWHP